MKNSILFALIVASAMFTACNKGGAAKAKVKTITTGRGQSTEFSYNADNKISQIKNSDSTKVSYTYAGNAITQTVSNPLRGQNMTQNMHLGSNGFIDSTSASDPSGNYLKLDTHDQDGYTINTKEFVMGALKRQTASVFKDGNEVSRTISDPNATVLAVITFDYTDKANTLAAENFGMSYLGKDSKNLMKKYVQVSATHDTMGTGTFSYKFDDKGRVIAKSTFDAKGMLVDSTNVTYY